MIKSLALFLALFLCQVCLAQTSVEAKPPPQELAGLVAEQGQYEKTLVHNAKIYTMDRGFSTADNNFTQ